MSARLVSRSSPDVRLPLPAVCPDCGADVLARADIEEPETQRRQPFAAPRVRTER